MAPITCSHKHKTHEQIPETSGQNNSDIKWLGDPRECNERLKKHYTGFVRNDTEISVNSFVSILCENDTDSLAYIVDMYETDKGDKIVKVRWFDYPEEIEGLTLEPLPHAREVFISRREGEISAECVDGIAAILTETDFRRCQGYLPPGICSTIFLCHRECEYGELNPFSLETLPGYNAQMVLSTLKYEVRRKDARKLKRILVQVRKRMLTNRMDLGN